MMFRITPVVINLILINAIVYLASLSFPEFMYGKFALHHPYSESFLPHQFLTHMFMHSMDGPGHILGNMLGLFFFAPMLEDVMGGKKFLIFYAITGFGAAALHLGVRHIEIQQLYYALTPEMAQEVLNNGFYYLDQGKNYTDSTMGSFNALVNGRMFGASGAVFGVLAGVGMLFPNRTIRLYMIIPIQIKFLVMALIGYEVFAVLPNTEDGVAHYAHLGGVLFGYALIKRWGFK